MMEMAPVIFLVVTAGAFSALNVLLTRLDLLPRLDLLSRKLLAGLNLLAGSLLARLNLLQRLDLLPGLLLLPSLLPAPPPVLYSLPGLGIGIVMVIQATILL